MKIVRMHTSAVVLPRRSFVARPWVMLLAAAGFLGLLLAGGCTSPAPSGAPPARGAWDNSEVIRAGRWAG